MKIAITGHTSGIGLAIYEHAITQGHTVTGFSRQSGYDLCDLTSRQKMIEILVQENYDILVNNAYPYANPSGMNGFMQTAIMNEMWFRWRGNRDKTIITIGSVSADHVKNHFHPYSVHKKSIDDTAKQLRLANPYPQVTVVKPSWVDTKIAIGTDSPKISPQQVAVIIDNIIESPVKILDITIEAK